MSATLPKAPPDRNAPPTGGGPLISHVRHRLLFRDTVTFLSLTAFTVLLFSATLLLFRSFAGHQHQLALRWSERGRAELAQGHPEQAVFSLRTALTYAPGQRADELMLAQALGDAGHIEESYTYFSGLWDRTPGDGLINLWLARLSAKKHDTDEAINFYRAAIYGTWPGDAILRRQQARLELAQYLIDHKQFSAAREELLIAGSNAGRNPDLDLQLSTLLASTGDPREALDYDLKAMADRPNDAATAVAAARLSDRIGDTPQTLHLTDRALHLLSTAKPETSATTAALADMRALRSELDRLQALDVPDTLPSSERARRLVLDATIARQRLASCMAATGAAPALAPLTALATQWTSLQPTLTLRALVHDHDAQDAVVSLIDNTESTTSSACGAPTGDDALLLRLARQHAAARGSSAS